MVSPIICPLSGRRIFVAGHRGMVGSALIRRLEREDCRILTISRDVADLRDQAAVDRWFDQHRPEAVLLAAARVGGIYDNDRRPADFLYDNLAIATNVIEASRRIGVAKLMFLGSSCIYPRLAPQPMPELLADRPARADQSMVRRREDRRSQIVPSLPPAIWLRFRIRDADKPVRPQRQFRPTIRPRLASSAREN
jgi:hypothetical protein